MITPARLRFEGYAFDPETRELWRGDHPVALPPKPSAVLATLLRHPGRLVTREELYSACWGHTAVPVDLALNTCIRQIREVLGDTATAPTFIQTVPRRGYRFVATVAATKAPDVADATGHYARWRTRLGVSSFAVVLIAVLLAGSRFLVPRSAATMDVLPVLVLDGAARSEVAPLLEERIRTELAHDRRDRLMVLAGRPVAPTARSVDYVVRGSLHSPVPGETRFSVQIVRTSDRAILWAGTFNPFCPDVQDPVGVIARLLNGALPHLI